MLWNYHDLYGILINIILINIILSIEQKAKG